jgi:hypothetical protein
MGYSKIGAKYIFSWLFNYEEKSMDIASILIFQAQHEHSIPNSSHSFLQGPLE